ncbi:MAG: type II toxin-antitoxin system VapC family toxin [Acidobacteriota bacterium]|nr:type II toxin-antitoxin system VapC family toxin [Acidobacteriota bacterium]
MPRKPKTIVLDSWAIMSYLQGEPSAERVADIIADAHEDRVPLLLSVVNAGEVWYIVARRTSEADADRSMRELKQLGIELVDADWDIAHDAGRFKAKHKMSFADCFAAALAKQRKAHLVTGDQEFKQVEADLIINWLK